MLVPAILAIEYCQSHAVDVDFDQNLIAIRLGYCGLFRANVDDGQCRIARGLR